MTGLIEEVRRQGVDSEEVLAAIARVPRELFVPAGERRRAYGNYPLPIGHGQTISQPFIVALMTELLRIEPGDRVLEVGTGSGYQAAVLVELGAEVYSLEVVPQLAERAIATLESLGYEGIHVRRGDGYSGWPDQAPFDKVIVTAAPEKLPGALLEQLAAGGRMVVPVGPQAGEQRLILVEKKADGGVRQCDVLGVAFVPMVRERQ